MLPMMWIETAKRPGHLGPGRDDCPIHIERQPPQPFFFDGVTHNLAVQLHQRLQRLKAKPLQPASHGRFSRQPRQAAKSLHEWVCADIAQVFEPPTPYQKQGQKHQNHVDCLVVSPQLTLTKCPLDAAMEAYEPQITTDQFQATMGCDVLRGKFYLEKTVAWSGKLSSTRSHLE
jgi:hypothetical protein